MLLSACLGNPFRRAEVDPQSPIAAEVAHVANPNQPYPTFASIPPMPKDVRPAAQYGREATAILESRTDLETKTAPQTWSLTDTEGFAAKALRDAGQEAAPTSSGDSAAFANAQRKRATPPPPPNQ